jgi:hypothetical protein
MNAFIALTSLLLIATKLFDCVSTAVKIKGPHHETNLLARHLMLSFGIHRTIWFIFALTVIIVAISHILVLYLDSPLCTWAYIITGLLTAVVQFAVGLANMKGKQNRITIAVAKSMGSTNRFYNLILRKTR